MPAVNTGAMRTKATNSTLNLVHPPIDRLVLLQGAFDDVVIGSHVPNVGFFTNITDTALSGAPLVGAASSGLLIPVFVGSGLTLTDGVLSVVGTPPVPTSVNLTGVQALSAPGTFSIGNTTSDTVLREDGSYLLREDGDHILREHEGE